MSFTWALFVAVGVNAVIRLICSHDALTLQ